MQNLTTKGKRGYKTREEFAFEMITELGLVDNLIKVSIENEGLKWKTKRRTSKT